MHCQLIRVLPTEILLQAKAVELETAQMYAGRWSLIWVSMTLAPVYSVPHIYELFISFY